MSDGHPTGCRCEECSYMEIQRLKDENSELQDDIKVQIDLCEGFEHDNAILQADLDKVNQLPVSLSPYKKLQTEIKTHEAIRVGLNKKITRLQTEQSRLYAEIIEWTRIFNAIYYKAQKGEYKEVWDDLQQFIIDGLDLPTPNPEQVEGKAE